MKTNFQKQMGEILFWSLNCSPEELNTLEWYKSSATFDVYNLNKMKLANFKYKQFNSMFQ